MDLSRLRRLGQSNALRLPHNAAPPIAIEFGAGALKILQVTGGDPPSLVSAACIHTPDDLVANPAKRLAFQVDALPELVKAGGFKGKRAVCGMPAGHTIVKHVQAARIQGVPLGDSVEQALCLQLGVPQGTILVRHFEVDVPGRVSSGSKSEVICIAASRDLVTGLMKAIKDCKLDPVGIHSEPIATLRAFEHVNRRDEDQHVATLYLDIGAHTTNLTIGHGKQLVFARKIDFGGSTLDRVIDKQTGCGIVKARARRIAADDLCAKASRQPRPAPAAARPGSTGIPALDALVEAEEARSRPASAVMEDRREGRPAPGFTGEVLDQPGAESVRAMNLTEPLEILTDEIAMCLRYHSSLFPDVELSRAIFLGGESRHLGLCQHVARAVRLPAQVADPMARVARNGSEMVVGVDFSAPQPGWSVPLGLCLCPTDL